MSIAIERKHATKSGTVITASTHGGLSVDRALIDPAPTRLATRQLTEGIKKNDVSQVERSVSTLARTLPIGMGQGLTANDKRDVLLALDAAATYAEKKEHWTLLEKILSVLALGIPFLIDALTTSDAEKVLARYKALRKKTDEHWLAHGVFRHDGDRDISGYMNLYVQNPLRDVTTKMAGAFGGEFQVMADHVATNTYSAKSKVDPGDFEATAGVVLIEKRSRRIVSQDAAGAYSLYSLDNRPVFKGNDGKFFFEPTGDKGPEPVPADKIAALKKTAVSDVEVGARFRMATDGPPREKMVFVWHGFGKRDGEQDVSWWGQCHASGMLGAMGVPPADSAIAFYDEATKKSVELDADQVTNLIVMLGDGAFYSAHRPDSYGEVNRDKEKLDADTPVGFHTFVSRQIAAGMPFNLESYSYDQIWNYPVGGASIAETGREALADGNAKVRYEMTLVESNGDEKRYYYFLTVDKKGNVVTSEWDLPACEAANGKNAAIPDLTVSYLNESTSNQEITAQSFEAKATGMTADAARLISDLYFAAMQRPQSGEWRVYTVRTKDGKLLQMSKAEYEQFRKGH